MFIACAFPIERVIVLFSCFLVTMYIYRYFEKNEVEDEKGGEISELRKKIEKERSGA